MAKEQKAFDQLVDDLANNRPNAQYLKGSTLDLSWQKLTNADVASLASAIAHSNLPITILNLSHNQIGDQGAKALATAIQQLKNITYLSLSYNQIGDQGVKALAPAIQQLENLTELYLSTNQIGYQGVKAMAPAIQQLKNLTWLSLYNNQIGDQGGEALAQLLENRYNTTLTILNIDANNISQSIRDRINKFL